MMAESREGVEVMEFPDLTDEEVQKIVGWMTPMGRPNFGGFLRGNSVRLFRRAEDGGDIIYALKVFGKGAIDSTDRADYGKCVLVEEGAKSLAMLPKEYLQAKVRRAYRECVRSILYKREKQDERMAAQVEGERLLAMAPEQPGGTPRTLMTEQARRRPLEARLANLEEVTAALEGRVDRIANVVFNDTAPQRRD